MEDTREKKERRSVSEKASLLLSSDRCNLCTFRIVSFAFYAAFGSSITFLPLYFKQIGLNAAQVGVLMGIRPFIQVIGSPVAGRLADKFRKRKIITIISLLAFAGRHFGLLIVNPKHHQTCLPANGTTQFVPANISKVVHKRVELSGNLASIIKKPRLDELMVDVPKSLSGERKFANHADRKFDYGHDKVQQRLGEQSKAPIAARNLATHKIHRHNISTNNTSYISTNQSDLKRMFIIFLSIIIICELFASSFQSLLDAAIVEYLAEDRNKYGYVRMWGSIGLGTASLAVGAVINQSSYTFCGTVIKDYSPMFYAVFGFCVLGFISLLNSKQVYSEAKEKFGTGIGQLKALFCGVRNMSFWMAIVCLGILDGFQMDFGPWFLDDLGTSPLMIGLATAFHFFVNACTYLVSNRILDSFGYMNTLSVGLTLHAVMFVLFSFAYSSAFAVVLFSLVGFVSSITWSCGITRVAMVATPLSFVSTAEGLLNGIYTGIGISTGTIIGGVITKLVDIRTTFRVLGVFSILVMIVFNALLWVDKRSSNTNDVSYQPLDKNEEPSDQ